MRRILFPTLLVAVGASLGVLLSWKITTSEKPIPSSSRPDSPPNAAQPAHGKSADAATVSQLLTKGVSPFTWKQIESTDYKQYMANLRSIGCPEETIRDIIIADVNKQFAPKIKVLMDQNITTSRSPHMGDPAVRAKAAEVRALKKERERVLVDLLGSTIISDFRDITGEFTPLNTRLDYLPETKRDAVADLEIRYRDAEQEVYFKAHGLSLPEDEKQRAELKQKMKADLAAILSPEELRQYELKTSDVAWKVRNEIEFFPVGDAEFSKLYDYRVALERLKDEGRSPSAFQEAKNELDQRLKSQLGENGYAQYLRSQDPGYRSAFQIAQRLELPASTADQVFELKARFELEKSAMISRANENTPAARQALKNDAETKLTELLGQEGFRIYKPRAGNWLDGLAP